MAADSDVQSEIEVLESIYLEELSVSTSSTGDVEVSVVLYPSTAEDALSQFVRLTLALTLDSQYPTTPPTISVLHPRGLSDDKLLSVQQCLQAEAQLCLGGPALYQLIEKAKEILTESNIPHGNCVICLYGFKEEEVFTKTSCYHYFHSYCLGRYVAHSETEIREREREMEEDKTRAGVDGLELTVVCPVCREPLTYDLKDLLASPAPCFPTSEQTMVGADFQKKWAEFQTLLERQRERGGVINPEAESNRFLIHTNEMSPDANNTNPCSDGSPCPAMPSAPSADTCPSQPGFSHSQWRGGPGHRRRGQSTGSRRGEGRTRHEEVVEEYVAKLSLSSEGKAGVKGENTTPTGVSQLECRLRGGAEGKLRPCPADCADVERRENACEPKAATPSETQSVKPAKLRSFSAGTPRGSSAPGKERGPKGDVGRRGDLRGSRQRFDTVLESTCEGGDWRETRRDRGGRGQRGRGGVNLQHRARGGSRGIGRDLNPRLLEEEGSCEGNKEVCLHWN
ncbi:E3 ubiquitin-protein ligase RNF25 [Scleropages formosus]|uniref:E3 ubiquitin-protein ligase RNF25 n=1 Tax=Scleropages formosus TaxID=113540 RepID=UPI0008782008|nr:E3 ubiquitin-protein ligase RNF25 [Scleropages formosus]